LSRHYVGVGKHPHVCGEDPGGATRPPESGETPPRVWGRLHVCTSTPVFGGNTPTCVGKTRLLRGCLVGCRKHPHVCGEDTAGTAQRCRNWETPPRVWGRRNPCLLRLSADGNTPTCVGKTLPAYTCQPTVQKHPHVCGEDARRLTRLVKNRETPPRVWGRPDSGYSQRLEG